MKLPGAAYESEARRFLFYRLIPSVYTAPRQQSYPKKRRHWISVSDK